MMEKFDIHSLLQLKRNEMPTEAFWDNFDAQLRLRLEKESVLEVRIPWLVRCLNWLQRSPLVSATCALALLLSCVLLNEKPQARYVAINDPVFITECQKSVLNGDLLSSGLKKDVIQKKMVASVATNCFSF